MELFKIDDLFNFEKGVLQSSKCTPGEFDFITASSDWKTHDKYTHDCEALVFAAAASGSLGRTHYVNGKFISSDLCFIITPKDPLKLPIDLKFYHLIFNEFKNDIVKNTKAGTSKEAIGLKSFGNYKLPYFDISKQIEVKQQFVELQLSQIELNKELITQISLVTQLRQAFLSEAMQGKLFQSELLEDQETSKQLLARIKAEKAQLIKEKKLKKEKELLPISPKEFPYELPKDWSWCRLGDVVCFLNGYSFKSEWFKDTGIRLLRNINLGINELLWKDVAMISEEKADGYKEYFLEEGDIILSLDRPIINAGLKLAQIKKTDLPCLLLQRVLKIKPFFVDESFLYHWFSSRLFIDNINPGRSIGIPHISHNDVSKIIIAIPPLSIQKQIVAKLDELMKTCDDLENSINQSQLQNEQLLQQVLKEALEVREEEII